MLTVCRRFFLRSAAVSGGDTGAGGGRGDGGSTGSGGSVGERQTCVMKTICIQVFFFIFFLICLLSHLHVYTCSSR